jgi:hypothetical protein
MQVADVVTAAEHLLRWVEVPGVMQLPIRLANGNLRVPRRAELEAGTRGNGAVELEPGDHEYASRRCGVDRLGVARVSDRVRRGRQQVVAPVPECTVCHGRPGKWNGYWRWVRYPLDLLRI